MPHNKTLAPKLFNIIDSIELGRKEIADRWVEIPSVSVVFKLHNISTKKFASGYGVPIIEYFIAVVREEKEVGDCPIMSKFVHFLLEKNITPKNVFDICMGFRRTLVSYMYDEKLINKNASQIMNEIADLFDANLSGVLDIFTTFYSMQQQKIEKASIGQKKIKHILQIINFINTKIIIIQNGRIILGNRPFFDALGVDDIKEYYNKYEDAWSFMKRVDIESKLFSDRNIEAWLRKLDQVKKHFKTDIFHHKAGKNFTYSGRITSLPDTDPVEYIIALNNIAAHLDDEAEAREKLIHDELTGLYNYNKFWLLLGESQINALKNNINLAMVVVDIPELRQINIENGQESGNRVIVEVAEDIQRCTGEDTIFARLEGSRFGILISYESEQEIYDWCIQLYMLLSEKPQRKTLSLTAFDLAETPNRLQMRAYDLIDIANSSESVIVKTDMENIEQYSILPEQKLFTDKFRNIKNIKTTVYYKELPITVNNTVVSVKKDSITISLSNKQFNCAVLHDPIYFTFEKLGHVKAHIEMIDAKNRVITINKFRFDKHSPLQRKKYRVQAAMPISVSIIHNNSESTGTLINLNENCIAVDMKRKKNLEEGALVGLDMLLPISPEHLQNINTDATILRIEKTLSGYKIVFLCHLNTNNEKLINQYISKCQIDIIQELKNKI
ncbi:diguanylate cyclase [bacterium]|nr:diguanylate cyclase [bacterium]MBU1994768.1 diguanylate cyclase [bacterium]